MKITGTSSHIKVESNNVVYLIQGERTVNGFLAYLNTISYEDELEKNEVTELEKAKIQKEVLAFTADKEFKIEFEDDKDLVDKKVAIQTLDYAIDQTNELQLEKESTHNYEDILEQLIYLKHAVKKENNRDSLATITLQKYAQECLSVQPKYSNSLSEAFGVMSLMKYGKL